MPELYKRNSNTNCLICNDLIYRRPREIEKGRVFCSISCYGIACRKEKPCIICEKPILASQNKKTCSKTCANKNRVGIKYKIGRPQDKARTSRTLKLRLMETRGEKCERCSYGKKEILQVHHKNRNSKDNRIENLEIICPNCHYEEHLLKRLKNKPKKLY